MLEKLVGYTAKAQPYFTAKHLSQKYQPRPNTAFESGRRNSAMDVDTLKTRVDHVNLMTANVQLTPSSEAKFRIFNIGGPEKVYALN